MQPITQEEIAKWWEIFNSSNPINGKLNGNNAAQLLKNSRLPDDELERVWDLSDIDGDGSLDFEEFCVAMKLTFDIINGIYKTAPVKLPEYLVPMSKSHLITTPPPATTFEWYISPDSKDQYERIYSSMNSQHGMVSFADTRSFTSTLQLPQSVITAAWELVAVDGGSRIGHDGIILFLHILNKCNNGSGMPTSLPAALKRSLETARPPVSFGNAYLSRLKQNPIATDFSSNKDIDWEQVRLEKELEALDSNYASLSSSLEEKRRQKVTPRADPASKKELEAVQQQLQTLSGLLSRREDELRSLKAQLPLAMQ